MCKFAPKITDYTGTEPVIEFEKFFNGLVKAWGIVQDRSGKVIKRFDIDMTTTWQAEKGTMREDFTYYGEKRGSPYRGTSRKPATEKSPGAVTTSSARRPARPPAARSASAMC